MKLDKRELGGAPRRTALVAALLLWKFVRGCSKNIRFETIYIYYSTTRGRPGLNTVTPCKYKNFFSNIIDQETFSDVDRNELGKFLGSPKELSKY